MHYAHAQSVGIVCVSPGEYDVKFLDVFSIAHNSFQSPSDSLEESSPYPANKPAALPPVCAVACAEDALGGHIASASPLGCAACRCSPAVVPAAAASQVCARFTATTARFFGAGLARTAVAVCNEGPRSDASSAACFCIASSLAKACCSASRIFCCCCLSSSSRC